MTLPPPSLPSGSTSPTVSSGALLGWVLSELPVSVVKTVARVVEAGHKEAAFVMGVLVAFGITPTTNATSNKIGASLLLGYAAVTRAVSTLKGTSS